MTQCHGIGDLVNDPKPSRASGYTNMALGGGGGIGHTVPMDRKAAATAPAGPRELRLEFEAEVHEGSYQSAAVAKWTQQIAGKWELVPADARTVELFDDPSLRQHVEQAISVARLYRSKVTSEYLSIDVMATNLRVPLACDVYVRAGGRETKFAGLSFSGKGVGNSGYGTGGRADNLGGATKVDVIFRPSIDVARGTPDITRIWNGEIVVKDVPVEDPDVTTRSSAR
jgi:hypothetical protein